MRHDHAINGLQRLLNDGPIVISLDFDDGVVSASLFVEDARLWDLCDPEDAVLSGQGQSIVEALVKLDECRRERG